MGKPNLASHKLLSIVIMAVAQRAKESGDAMVYARSLAWCNLYEVMLTLFPNQEMDVSNLSDFDLSLDQLRELEDKLLEVAAAIREAATAQALK